MTVATFILGCVNMLVLVLVAWSVTWPANRKQDEVARRQEWWRRCQWALDKLDESGDRELAIKSLRILTEKVQPWADEMDTQLLYLVRSATQEVASPAIAEVTAAPGEVVEVQIQTVPGDVSGAQ